MKRITLLVLVLAVFSSLVFAQPAAASLKSVYWLLQ